MLQEAVDALFDNAAAAAFCANQQPPAQSLSDTLKGKQGRFRQNLLGKRVDYSGRSVIVVGPELKLHQCGLPKKMALEALQAVHLSQARSPGPLHHHQASQGNGRATGSRRWDILEDVIGTSGNAQPAPRRFTASAFKRSNRCSRGKAIRIHPLVCTASTRTSTATRWPYTSRFRPNLQVEASVLMLSSPHILSPAHGLPLAVPSQDMVLGIYYLTKNKPGAQGRRPCFRRHRLKLSSRWKPAKSNCSPRRR